MISRDAMRNVLIRDLRTRLILVKQAIAALERLQGTDLPGTAADSTWVPRCHGTCGDAECADQWNKLQGKLDLPVSRISDTV